MAETTTIEITKENWRRLNTRKQAGDSFNDVINRLLSDVDVQGDELEGDQGDVDGDLDELVDKVGREWQGDTDERRKAALAALEWLRNDGGPAGASDFRGALLPSYAVDGQNETTWWRKTVRPTLQAAADRDLVRYRPGHHDYRWVE